MMYKFRDILPYTGMDDTDLPPEAILIDNVPIESYINGFQTLNVTGRELIAKKIQSQDVDGIDGNIFIESHYPTRDIVVKFLLVAEDDEDFRRKFEKLNYILSKDQFDFSFNDDKEYFYTGTLSAVDNFPEGTNRGVSSFTLTCSDPFKYKKEPSVYEGYTMATVYDPILYDTLPDEMDITLSSATSSFTVKNSNGLVLTFNGTFKTGDIVKILPKSDDQILLNGVATPSLMTYTSPLEVFYLKENSRVQASNGTITLKIRDKRL